MSQQKTAPAPSQPLTTVGHPTPRIDALERVTGKATYTQRHQTARHALCAQCCEARIRTRASVDRYVQGQALPGVKSDPHPRELSGGVGRRSEIAGGQQYNDEVKKITKQRRYVFNNPVRFVGDPVAAVAAINRHVAEEAHPSDHRSTTKMLPISCSSRKRRSRAAASQIWPEGNLSLEQPTTRCSR